MTEKDEKIRTLKRLGFLDGHLGEEAKIRGQRQKAGITPTYKMVDTCAAEFEAYTPYYYSSYEDESESTTSDRKKIIILGSGPIRIGQGIEFDCCTVHAVFALREEGIETIIVNNNPETVSTDFDISDKLYFEPITCEDVLNIVETEDQHLLGVMVQFGGQTAINLARDLEQAGVAILGTTPDAIDLAENRDRFGTVLADLDMPSADWGTGRTFAEVKDVADSIGYPVLVRPSYVLGGRAMEIVYNAGELESYMQEAARVSGKHPVLVDKFLQDAVEVDVDAVCDGKDVLIGAVMEHIEAAGVHSGDSACVIPPQTLPANIIATIEDYTRKLALRLGIVGLLNVQYAVKDGVVYTLEANPRSSRTVPFVSKAVGISLAKIAAKVMVGHTLADLAFDLNPMRTITHVAVKEVVFPFLKLPGVDPTLSPEMKSTGEVIGLDRDFSTAYYKAQLSAGNKIPAKGTVFISVRDEDKQAMIDVARRFADLGFTVVSTRGTSAYFGEQGLQATPTKKISEGQPNILDLMHEGNIDLIVNTPPLGHTDRDGYQIRRAAIELSIPYVTTYAGAKASVAAVEHVKNRELSVASWNSYFS